uniref:Uncharacterized protein n=1 Tax=Panagrolaimus superbus TaxID=310955 RepID=A0A914ZCZ5_9BILA
MEILWWYLKFDYCPAVCFNKILAKHSLNEMVLPQPQGNYFPVMDYSIVFEENTFSSFDEAFISMLKYNQLFSDLPNNSGCCKTIARDFIKDNIATFEYLLDPSNENRDNAINQLRNKKYDVINPKIQAKMESYDAKTKEIFIRCLTFRKRVIAQRREMINKYYDIRKKNEYFNFSFVQSGSLNNNQIDDAVAKSGIQTANQRCKTADKSMQTEHIFDDDDCCSKRKMDVDNIGGIDLVSTPSILKPLGSSRKSRRILEKAKKDTITAAEIPNLRDASEAADDDDRDEIISNSEGYKCFKNSNVHTYLYACESKFKGDTHNVGYF